MIDHTSSNRDFLEKINDSFQEVIIAVRLPKFVIEYTNAGMEKLFGYSSDECFGDTISILYETVERYIGFVKEIENAITNHSKHIKTVSKLRKKTGGIFTAEIATSFINGEDDTEYAVSIIRKISDIELFETRLHEEKLKLSLMAESIQDVFWVSTQGVGEMLYISPGYERLWGRSRETLYQSPLSFLEIVHPDDLQIVSKHIQKAHAKGLPYECEYRILLKNGPRWIHERGFPAQYLWKGKKIMTGVCTDITEQKSAEDSLRKSESRFRQLFENISCGIIIYEAIENGADFIIRDFNKAAEKIERLSKREVVGKSIFEVFPGIVEFGIFEALKNVWQNGLPVYLPAAFYKDNRISGWRENYIYKLSTGELIISYEDVSKRKKAEKLLEESKKRFRELADLLPETIFEINLDGDIGFVNHKAFDQFGYKKSDLNNGLNIKDIISVEDRSAIERSILEVFNGNDISLIEFSALRKDGTTFPALFNASKIAYENIPVGLRGLVIDISEKKGLEAQLLQTQKMEAIGVLAGGIAHDFNNILTSIIGFTQLALRDSIHGTKQKEDLLAVFAASERAKELVRQILTFARQTNDPMAAIRIDSILKEGLKFLRSSIPTTIKIEQNIQSKSFIMGNATQIHQIIMNLCTNAAHAMDESGGILKVDMKDAVIDGNSEAGRLGVAPGEYMEIAVSDTGIGIPPNIINNIFEPYFTTKKRGEGTGMGLAMVQGIVKKSGGAILVESQLEEGTCIRVFLPTVDKDQDHPNRHEYEEATLIGKEKILFVDDEASIAMVAERLLETLGYTVETEVCSLNALKNFKANADSFDMVITDMTMPFLTGDKLSAELLKIRPDIPIILCTGFSKRISKVNMAEMGVKAIIFKPLSISELSRTIRSVIDGS